ncbi:MAG: glycosyltransferase family 2 protein [Myxococcales bacterium]|nr:glycosyltransferase family 2 protein [Myxococcales bacterium]
MPDLSLIVFAFNEAQNVGPVLDELRAWLDQQERTFELIFVDDGSTDGTGERAAQHLDGCPHKCLRHPSNRGIGAALKTGVAAANGDWVTFLPADGQIPAESVGTLRAAADASGADVVFSVYDHRDDGFDRKILSAGVRALITLVHGVSLRSEGPYLFRRRLFVPQELASDSFFLNFEFPIGVLQAGLRTTEVTIECRPRRSGASKTARLSVIGRVAKELVDLRIRKTRTALRRFTL